MNRDTTSFAIYQINSDRDKKRVMFFDSELTTKILGEFKVDGVIYDRVYSGNLSVKDLENIHYIFNMDHPEDFRGRSLSVSDVVEILDSPSMEPGFYFCDSFGFTRISFEKELTQDSQYYNAKENAMEIYNISFQKNDVYQARLVKAQSMEQAEAYFRHIEPHAEFIGIGINQEGYKPGKHIETVPEGWESTQRIQVVVVEPEKPAYAVEIEADLHNLQSLVGGYIEPVSGYYLGDDDACILVNEEGKLDNLPYNRALTDPDDKIVDIIQGNFVIIGTEDEDFIGLTQEQTDRFLDKYKEPEYFVAHENSIQLSKNPPSKKMSLNERLAKAQAQLEKMTAKDKAHVKETEREL